MVPKKEQVAMAIVFAAMVAIIIGGVSIIVSAARVLP